MKNNSEDGAIVLNRMYVGDYLATNLGHEVINMYKADDDNHYLYLNAYGSFAKKWQNKVNYMLFTKYHGKDCTEVIGKAVNLCDLFDYDKDEGNNSYGDNEVSNNQNEIIKGIFYGGVPLIELFSDAERQNVYVTFKAEKVYKIAENKRILIHFVPQKNNDKYDEEKVTIDSTVEDGVKNTQIDIYLTDTKLALASLDQFFERKDSDYELLYSLFYDEHSDYWTQIDKKVELPKNYNPRKESIFDICQIQNDENRISNTLAYFMKQRQYRKIWLDFFSFKCGILINEEFVVTREKDFKLNRDARLKGRIDIFIKDSQNAIIIENKIKSGINKKSSDIDGIDQIDRYNLFGTQKYKNQFAIILLVPKYNEQVFKRFIKSKTYLIKLITYKELCEYLDKYKNIIGNDLNFKDFINVLNRHTHDNVNDYLYFEMQEKFYRRIKEYKLEINNK